MLFAIFCITNTTFATTETLKNLKSSFLHPRSLNLDRSNKINVMNLNKLGA